MVEESLYDGVGCESRGDGGVVGGVVGVFGGEAGGGFGGGYGGLSERYFERGRLLGCLCIASYTQTNSMSYSMSSTVSGGPSFLLMSSDSILAAFYRGLLLSGAIGSPQKP